MATKMLAAVSTRSAAPGTMPGATLTLPPCEAVSNGSAGERDGGGDGGSNEHASGTMPDSTMPDAALAVTPHEAASNGSAGGGDGGAHEHAGKQQ